MNLHQRGTELVSQLKALVLEALLSHPDGGFGRQGVSQREIARRAGLHRLGTLELDHTCHEMLSLLRKDGHVESLAEAGQTEKEVCWRFCQK